MEGAGRERPRFTLTRSESKALLGLAVILFIGLAGQQVKRYLERDSGTLVIENAIPLLADSSNLAQGLRGNELFDSLRLDVPSSPDVTSTPKPSASFMQESSGFVEAGKATEPGPSGLGTRLDLNRAGSEELQALPGIGPVLASRILVWRAEHGRFDSVDDLLLVRGIGEVRLEKLKAFVTVHP